MSLGNRLHEIVEHSGLTSRQVALKVGIDVSQFSKMLRSELGISYEKAKALGTEYGINTEWIIDGTGEKWINVPHSENSIPQQKESYLERRRSKKLKNEPVMVPFMPVKAQAGYVRAMDQEMFVETLEKYALPPGVDPTGAVLRYWEIQGDSMEGKDNRGFKQGDIILTSQVPRMDWDQLRNFYVYVIVTAEAVLIKRVFCKNSLEWVLISENEDLYPQQLIPAESVKEMWLYRRTWKMDAAPTKRFEIKV